MNALHRANLDGLRAEDYHLAAIRTLLRAVRGDIRHGGVIVPDRWAELDLLLTDAFLVFGSHLLAARVNYSIFPLGPQGRCVAICCNSTGNSLESDFEKVDLAIGIDTKRPRRTSWAERMPRRNEK